MLEKLGRVVLALALKLAPPALATLGTIAVGVHQEWFLAFCRGGF